MADLHDNKKSRKLTVLKWLFVYLPVYIVLDIFVPPVTYIFHYCLIGLIIGYAFSFGLNENEVLGRKKLLSLIFLCSLSALAKCIIITTHIIIKYIVLLLIPIDIIFSRPIDLIFLCPLFLGIYVFLFCKKNRVDIVFVGVSFVGCLIIHKINKLPWNLYSEDYNILFGFRLIIGYILFFCFFSLLIIELISYMIKKKGVPDKKKFFMWIILCSLSFI